MIYAIIAITSFVLGYTISSARWRSYSTSWPSGISDDPNFDYRTLLIMDPLEYIRFDENGKPHLEINEPPD
jgi:hypothetical protein